MKKIYFLLFALLIASLSFGQVIVSEDFNYPDGSLVPNGSWVNHSGNAGDLLVSSGLAVVQHGTPSEDANLPFTAISGNIYYALDFSVDDLGAPYSSAGTDYEYFVHFKEGNNFSARLDIVPPTGSGDFSVGIASDESTADAVWATDLTFGVTYRAVVRYDQDNNIAELWIDASASTDTSILGEDRANPGDAIVEFALRQSDSDENETIRVDNVVVGETFEDVVNPVTSTETIITINSPSDFAVLASGTTSVDIVFTAANLNSGDQVDITVTKNGGTPDKTTNVSSPFTISGTADGDTFVVTAEIVNGATQIDFETIDFSIALPCDLILGTITTTCDATTSGVDTYTTSIDFTGGNTGITYTLATDVGAISGDNPSNTSAGTITITGVNEGTDIIVTVVGGTGSSCDLSINITGPVCKALPLEEPFDYTVGVNLVDVSDWENFSGTDNEFDVVSGSLSYSGLAASTGNSIHIEGGFVDSRLLFTPVTSGTVFSSFIFNISDLSSITDFTDGGYFAVLGNFDARLWVRPDTDPAGTTFDIALTNASSGSGFTTTKYNVGDDIFIVMSYEMSTGILNGWVNPSSGDFGGSAPTVTMTDTDASPSANIDRFILRQDSTGETPPMTFDELRIGTSWADVTPTGGTASVRENDIPGFIMYPNPVTNGRLTINTFSNANKEIQIFDILGKRILSTNLKGRELNVSKLNSGIYILKILEEGKTATRKLVIK